MSIMRSWPRSPRSASCAPLSSWNRAPNPNPNLGPSRSARSPRPPTSQCTCYRIKLRHADAATFDAALQSHHDALIAEWKHDHDNPDHDNGDRAADHSPPLPSTGEAFMRLVESGWDAEAARRPHGHHTTVVMHLDVEQRVAALHLGPLLSEADRQYLSCDATCEVWFERDGLVIGSGRATRLINRRLRRALEHRHPTLRGARLWRHSRSARSPHPALGRRRSHRVGQPGAGLPLSSPVAPSRRHHHHRTRTPTSPSPTARAENSAPGRWPVHRISPRPQWHRVPDPPASAPTGGGMNPSSPNHHRQTTRSVAAVPVITSAISTLKQVGASRDSFALLAATAS